MKIALTDMMKFTRFPFRADRMQQPAAAFDLLAAQALAKRTKALRKQLDRLIGDPQSHEHVHQLRVAGRRLRVALRGFADTLPAKKVKRWNKDIRRLTRALGRVRDADVQLQFIDDFIATHTTPASALTGRRSQPAWLTGVKRLQLRLVQLRDRQACGIDRAIARFQSSFAARTLPQPSDQQPDLADPALRQHADQAIAPRVKALLAFAPFVDQPDCVEELHRMRIAAKQLRYTLELYEPILRGKQKRMLTRVRNLQALLGDLHDCDMWILHLPAFLESEHQRMIEYQGHQRGFKRIAAGIDHLLHDRRLARSVCYQALNGYWRRIQDDKTFILPTPAPPETPPTPPPALPPPAPTVLSDNN